MFSLPRYLANVQNNVYFIAKNLVESAQEIYANSNITKVISPLSTLLINDFVASTVVYSLGNWFIEELNDYVLDDDEEGLNDCSTQAMITLCVANLILQGFAINRKLRANARTTVFTESIRLLSDDKVAIGSQISRLEKRIPVELTNFYLTILLLNLIPSKIISSSIVSLWKGHLLMYRALPETTMKQLQDNQISSLLLMISCVFYLTDTLGSSLTSYFSNPLTAMSLSNSFYILSFLLFSNLKFNDDTLLPEFSIFDLNSVLEKSSRVMMGYSEFFLHLKSRFISDLYSERNELLSLYLQIIANLWRSPIVPGIISSPLTFINDELANKILSSLSVEQRRELLNLTPFDEFVTSRGSQSFLTRISEAKQEIAKAIIIKLSEHGFWKQLHNKIAIPSPEKESTVSKQVTPLSSAGMFARNTERNNLSSGVYRRLSLS